MAATRRLSELEDEALGQLELPEGTLVVALSGGADSASLAHLCVRAGWAATAIHVNHGLTHAARMEAAAREIAEALSVSIQVVEIQVPEGPSPENQARQARYDVLENMEGAVLTAHTENDVAETMLINMIRGTGTDGLTGIPRHRPPNIYRPMLEVSRSVTREIATLAGLPFVDDPSNRDRSLLRNHVRLDLIPLFEASNPRFVQSMATTARLLAEDRKLLDEMASGHQSGEVIPVGLLVALPRPIADRIVRGTLARAGVETDAAAIARAWSVVTGETSRQELNQGYVMVRDRAVVRVEKAI